MESPPGPVCIGPDDTLLQHQVQNQDCITITRRLHGGTKDGTCGTTKQIIIDALVAQGQPAQAVATHVEGLVALLTPEQHKSVQSAPDSRQTCAIIRKHAKQHNVALSNLFPTRQNKPRPAVRQLELTDLSIEEGTFLNADGTHAAIGGHFTVVGKGVYTSLPESMQHLPQESKPLCKHELALIVLRVPAPKRPCEKVVFTALDHTGNKLILAGWIIQFGEGKVSIAKPDRFDVPVPSCSIFALASTSSSNLRSIRMRCMNCGAEAGAQLPSKLRQALLRVFVFGLGSQMVKLNDSCISQASPHHLFIRRHAKTTRHPPPRVPR